MIPRCLECGAPLKERVIERYEETLLGIPLVLINAVIWSLCENCGEVALAQPDLPGLTAAAAIARCLRPLRLGGAELKFLRKALDLTPGEFAALLGTTADAVRAWESDGGSLEPAAEKQVRQAVCAQLRALAPAQPYAPEEIAALDLVSATNQPEPPLTLERVALPHPGQDDPDYQWHAVNLPSAA